MRLRYVITKVRVDRVSSIFRPVFIFQSTLSQLHLALRARLRTRVLVLSVHRGCNEDQRIRPQVVATRTLPDFVYGLVRAGGIRPAVCDVGALSAATLLHVWHGDWKRACEFEEGVCMKAHTFVSVLIGC